MEPWSVARKSMWGGQLTARHPLPHCITLSYTFFILEELEEVYPSSAKRSLQFLQMSHSKYINTLLDACQAAVLLRAQTAGLLLLGAGQQGHRLPFSTQKTGNSVITNSKHCLAVTHSSWVQRFPTSHRSSLASWISVLCFKMLLYMWNAMT